MSDLKGRHTLHMYIFSKPPGTGGGNFQQRFAFPALYPQFYLHCRAVLRTTGLWENLASLFFAFLESSGKRRRIKALKAFKVILSGWYYCTHFVEKERKIQRDKVTCQRKQMVSRE